MMTQCLLPDRLATGVFVDKTVIPHHHHHHEDHNLSQIEFIWSPSKWHPSVKWTKSNYLMPWLSSRSSFLPKLGHYCEGYRWTWTWSSHRTHRKSAMYRYYEGAFRGTVLIARRLFWEARGKWKFQVINGSFVVDIISAFKAAPRNATYVGNVFPGRLYAPLKITRWILIAFQNWFVGVTLFPHFSNNYCSYTSIAILKRKQICKLHI